MTADEIIDTLRKFRDEGKSMFVTSSFQSHSIPLLHIVMRSEVDIPVYCLNTGFLFPETLEFRDQLAQKYGLDIRTISSDIPKSQQRDAAGNFLFTSDPDQCCYINKVQPTEKLLDRYDIWINGIRADQNRNRRNMKIFQKTLQRAERFHPMLDWSAKDIYDYIREYDLPKHPLENKGYMSIGCEPCTHKVTSGDIRDGRWAGLNKTECGLHTELAPGS